MFLESSAHHIRRERVIRRPPEQPRTDDDRMHILAIRLQNAALDPLHGRGTTPERPFRQRRVLICAHDRTPIAQHRGRAEGDEFADTKAATYGDNVVSHNFVEGSQQLGRGGVEV